MSSNGTATPASVALKESPDLDRVHTLHIAAPRGLDTARDMEAEVQPVSAEEFALLQSRSTGPGAAAGKSAAPQPAHSSASGAASTIATYEAAPRTTWSIHPETVRLAAYVMFWLMVLLATFVTKVWISEDNITNSALIKMFGYNNVCIMWDYEPARSVTAMFYPLVEIPLVFYIVLNFLRCREARRINQMSSIRYVVVQTMAPVELVMILWFRMIFVVDAFVDTQGHTLGFHGLMIGMCLVALQNYLYYDAVGQLVGPQWLSIGYLVALYLVTSIKMIIAWSIFAGTPLWNVATNTDGNSFAQSMDICWMILASVIPAWLAWKNRKTTDPMELSFQLDPAHNHRRMSQQA